MVEKRKMEKEMNMVEKRKMEKEMNMVEKRKMEKEMNMVEKRKMKIKMDFSCFQKKDKAFSFQFSKAVFQSQQNTVKDSITSTRPTNVKGRKP